jgi:hypothetical protein
MDRINLDQTVWRKAKASADTGQCVEVAANLQGIIAVRDSKNPAGAVLKFTPAEWSAFIGGVKDGEFG